MLAFLFKTCILIAYSVIIIIVAKQFEEKEGETRSFQFLSFHNKDTIIRSFSSFVKDNILHKIHSKFVAFKEMNKENIPTSFFHTYFNTPTLFNAERVAMGTRDVSDRMDVLLSACVIGSFVWMCSFKFRI